MNTIVSLLSDQLIPNVLFIKQFGAVKANHIFVSTQEMEQRHKSAILAETLALKTGRYHVLLVDANDPLLIAAALENYSWNHGTPYIVNITGGTKMMSQMAYNHFASGVFDCKIYYTSISAPYLTLLYPEVAKLQKKREPEISLLEYFLAHGFTYTKIEGFTFPVTKANDLMRKTIGSGGPENVPEIRRAKSESYQGNDKAYLTGEWFEDWVFEFLRDSLKLGESQIARGLEIKSRFSRSGLPNDNEIDVAFVHDNRLFLVECKVFNKADGKKINDIIYKSASIRQTLGLQATSLVFVCAELGDTPARKTALADKCRLMNVKYPFSLHEFQNKIEFQGRIKIMFGYGT